MRMYTFRKITITATFFLISSAANSHQGFRILSSDTAPTLPDIPAISETSSFDAEECSVYQAHDKSKYYVLPTRLYRIPGPSGALFAASLESEAQDHVAVVLLHGIDADKISLCAKEFKTKIGDPSAVVDLYPATLSDVTLISDPQDYRTLKFNFTYSSRVSFNNQMMLMTIIQASSKENVRNMKKLLSLQLDAVAEARIRVQKPDGTIEFRPITLSVDLGHIGLSSQGL